MRQPAPNPQLDDLAYQDAILQDVSRTFALTIPLLPEGLRIAVGNAYLLCRIADTIEDSPDLAIADKLRFSELFVNAVAARIPPESFGDPLCAALGGGTTGAEKELVRNTARVLRLTHSFAPADRAAIERCVRIMTEGMEQFQEGQFTTGLREASHLDAYCYHVAGVVGEMLTALFCAHSPGCAARRADLERLAVSFGEGLQLVNILKDVWEDKSRNVCWLPRDVFDRRGFDLAALSPANHGTAFQAGLEDLIALTHTHLRNALEYTLLIPRNEPGIRSFCLLALGLAVLTLRKLNRNRGFVSGNEAKVTRRTVHLTWLLIRYLRGSASLLRLSFAISATGLPKRQP